jgi:hypothetical protein
LRTSEIQSAYNDTPYSWYGMSTIKLLDFGYVLKIDSFSGAKSLLCTIGVRIGAYISRLPHQSQLGLTNGALVEVY